MAITYSIIGLGKLGASMAAAIASRGFDVVGVDVNAASVDAVNAGRAPVQETGLDELLGAHRQRVRATSSCRDAVLASDFTLIGELDEGSGARLESAYGAIMLNRAPCRRMTLENAELTKIAVNTFVTTKIAFANMLADLCERIPGGDVDAVSGALGLDDRIGRKYLTGALGYGGPCFPRDNVALGFFARALGSRAAI